MKFIRIENVYINASAIDAIEEEGRETVIHLTSGKTVETYSHDALDIVELIEAEVWL